MSILEVSSTTYYRQLPTVERVWLQVDFAGPCWQWAGNVTRAGYGYVTRTIDGKRRHLMVHRVVYESLVGPIPDGLTLDHLCRNTSCVNPDHLDPVTGKVNQLRGYSPLAQNARKTHCLNGHPLTEDNVYRPPKHREYRACRTCRREHDIRRRRSRAGFRVTCPVCGEQMHPSRRSYHQKRHEGVTP